MNFTAFATTDTYNDARKLINFLETETPFPIKYLYTLEHIVKGEEYFQVSAAYDDGRNLTEENIKTLKGFTVNFFERIRMNDADRLLALEVARLTLRGLNCGSNIKHASDELDIREDVLESLGEKLEYYLNS